MSLSPCPPSNAGSTEVSLPRKDRTMNIKRHTDPPADIFDHLSYQPDTGEFRWLISPVNGVRRGQESGCVDSNGYLVIGFRGRRYLAHRLAWLFQTGEWPKHSIDHKNIDKTDNRIANLRLATNAQNSANRPKWSGCSSKYKGVTLKRNGRWKASIRVAGKSVHLGVFEREADAGAAYISAAAEVFGEFARSA
jgi:hypothetical protein